MHQRRRLEFRIVVDGLAGIYVLVSVELLRNYRRGPYP
ncbi:Protein of unknown function, partial [Gryllus bimaculatus]